MSWSICQGADLGDPQLLWSDKRNDGPLKTRKRRLLIHPGSPCYCMWNKRWKLLKNKEQDPKIYESNVKIHISKFICMCGSLFHVLDTLFGKYKMWMNRNMYGSEMWNKRREGCDMQQVTKQVFKTKKSHDLVDWAVRDQSSTGNKVLSSRL